MSDFSNFNQLQRQRRQQSQIFANKQEALQQFAEVQRQREGEQKTEERTALAERRLAVSAHMPKSLEAMAKAYHMKGKKLTIQRGSAAGNGNHFPAGAASVQALEKPVPAEAKARAAAADDVLQSMQNMVTQCERTLQGGE